MKIAQALLDRLRKSEAPAALREQFDKALADSIERGRISVSKQKIK